MEYIILFAYMTVGFIVVVICDNQAKAGGVDATKKSLMVIFLLWPLALLAIAYSCAKIAIQERKTGPKHHG